MHSLHKSRCSGVLGGDQLTKLRLDELSKRYTRLGPSVQSLDVRLAQCKHSSAITLGIFVPTTTLFNKSAEGGARHTHLPILRYAAARLRGYVGSLRSANMAAL